MLQRLPRLNRIDTVTDFKRIRLDGDGIPRAGVSHNA